MRRTRTDELRIANLNTLRQGLSDAERAASMKRLLAAAKADVICFQEEWDESKFREAVADVLGGDQLNLHWSGGCGIATTLELEPLPMQLDRGAGALVKLASGDFVAVISLHFKCCGYAGSKEDRTRIYQAEQLAAQIRNLREGSFGDSARNAAIAVVGDYNHVGSRKPLDILKSLGLSEAYLQSSDGAGYTWRGLSEQESFWPGRLDLITYDRLRQTNGIVLDTSRLSETELDRLKLRRDDSLASDHLLLIADFRLER